MMRAEVVLTEWSEITTISRRAIQVLDAHGRNMTGRDGRDWEATHYRTHTLGEVRDLGAQMIGHEVTVAGYAEAVRGRGAICFPMLRDGTGHLQAFPEKGQHGRGVIQRNSKCKPRINHPSHGNCRSKTTLQRSLRANLNLQNEYEINVTSGQILALAETPLPVGVTDDVHVGLDVRLDNRHLDLRRAHVNAMFQLRGKVLQYGREHLITEGFSEMNSPKIIASASEGGTNLFPMKYFETDAYLSQSPQLYKQLAVLGGLERVFEIGPAFRAEKHDTYRHLNEFISFDIEGAWMNDEDVMCVQERMIHHIWSQVAANDQNLIDVINEYRASQEQDPITVQVPSLPFPRISYCEAIEIVKEGGGEIEWGDDIESHHCDLIAAKYPGFHFLPRWPMSMKPFYIFHDENEKGSTGGQLSRGFDLNYGRDEMTSGGQREHRVEVLEQNLRDMDLDPSDFTFYTDGFRYGAPLMRVGDLEWPDF